MNKEEFSSSEMTGLLYKSHDQSSYRIVYLHGSGEFGNGIEGLFKYPGLPSLLEKGLELEFDVIIPCGPKEGQWTVDWLDRFLCSVESGFRQNTYKYHMVGYSRGCGGVYKYSMKNPEKVASIVCLAGKSASDSVEHLLTIPVLLIHGINDDNIPVTESRLMHQWLIKAGATVKFIEESGNHYIAEQVFSRKDMFNWQKRMT